jgi:hypothetical protein
MVMRSDLFVAAGAVAAAAVLALAWPAPPAAPAGDTAAAAAPEAAAVAAAERLAAAARLCAEGCDAVITPAEMPASAGDGAMEDTTLAAADLPELPADLDDWALHPEAVSVPGEAPVVVRMHNVPPVPDDKDTTPADESDPEAVSTEATAGE